jgi:hypothetical protein
LGGALYGAGAAYRAAIKAKFVLIAARFRSTIQNVGQVIVSQICETMIRMSRLGSLALVGAVVLLATAVGGCCGGAHSHQCDFTPLKSQDSGSDGPPLCGSELCTSGQVCCVTKVPVSASCIPPEQFLTDHCEMPTSTQASCFVPSDCQTGQVCCLNYSAASVNCTAPPSCPGNDGNTFILCATDQDCPGQMSGSCRPVNGTAPDGGAAISACYLF